MNLQTTNIKTFNKVYKGLTSKEEQFFWTVGGNSERIDWGPQSKKGVSKYRVFYSPHQISKSDLSFISAVRRYAENLDIPEQPKRHCNYIGLSKVLDHSFELDNVMEIDVNRAYWVIAYQKGYISKELYEKGKNEKGQTVDKMIRLMSLGSLARQRTIFEYYPDQGMVKIEDDVNEKTRSYFLDVCGTLDGIMLDAISKCWSDHVLFYWVDALFCRNHTDRQKEQNENLVKFFDSYGLGVKFQPIKRIWNKTIGNKNQGYRRILYAQDDRGETETKFRSFSLPVRETSAATKDRFKRSAKQFLNLPAGAKVKVRFAPSFEKERDRLYI